MRGREGAWGRSGDEGRERERMTEGGRGLGWRKRAREWRNRKNAGEQLFVHRNAVGGQGRWPELQVPTPRLFPNVKMPGPGRVAALSINTL